MLNHRITDPIYVGKSKFGRGVFAKRNILKGERICIFKGAKINSQDFIKESKRGRDTLVDPFQIGRDEYLVLDEPYLLFNHSCNPNSGFKNNTNLVAIEDIKKDSEIFYDYSSVWFEAFKCSCGSKKCRKYISEYYTIPAQVRRRYKKLGILPDFIK